MTFGIEIIPATAGGVILINIANRIIWDWLKNRKNNSDKNGRIVTWDEHERICNSRLENINNLLSLMHVDIKEIKKKNDPI